MTTIKAVFSGALLAIVLLSSAAAADLGGKWTTDGRYVFSFARVGDAWTGVVTETGSSREFKLADIVVIDGERVSFFVVHDAAWDEEVKANGGRAFRNTATGTLTDSSLTISGAREGTGERAYRAELKRVQ
jgi:hypothetical protein